MRGGVKQARLYHVVCIVEVVITQCTRAARAPRVFFIFAAALLPGCRRRQKFRHRFLHSQRCFESRIRLAERARRCVALGVSCCKRDFHRILPFSCFVKLFLQHFDSFCQSIMFFLRMVSFNFCRFHFLSFLFPFEDLITHIPTGAQSLLEDKCKENAAVLSPQACYDAVCDVITKSEEGIERGKFGKKRLTAMFESLTALQQRYTLAVMEGWTLPVYKQNVVDAYDMIVKNRRAVLTAQKEKKKDYPAGGDNTELFDHHTQTYLTKDLGNEIRKRLYKHKDLRDTNCVLNVQAVNNALQKYDCREHGVHLSIDDLISQDAETIEKEFNVGRAFAVPGKNGDEILRQGCEDGLVAIAVASKTTIIRKTFSAGDDEQCTVDVFTPHKQFTRAAYGY